MYNILHLKYAIEVAKTGSISKAASNLYMGQPHLSKAIKELEESLDMVIFNRTSKGVIATPKGEEFLIHAKKILAHVEEMRLISHSSNNAIYALNIAAPRASYISYALADFINSFDKDKDIKINYREANSIRGINNIANSINDIAIIRYQTVYEKYFLNTLAEKELKYELLYEFEKGVLMPASSPLATSDDVDYDSLEDYIEITHGDISVPSLPISEARQLAQVNDRRKSIAIYERGSQFDLLSKIPLSYMFAPNVPNEILTKYSLVQKKCVMKKNNFKDILIYRKSYHFSNIDEEFITFLKERIKTL